MVLSIELYKMHDDHPIKKKNFNYKFGHNFIEVLFCVRLKYINW